MRMLSKEELEELWNVETYDCPFLSSIANHKAEDAIHEWQRDNLPTDNDNVRLRNVMQTRRRFFDTVIMPDGNDYIHIDLTGDEITQWFEKFGWQEKDGLDTDEKMITFKLTVGDKIVTREYQENNYIYVLRNLKRDFEAIALNNQSIIEPVNANDAPQMRGVPTWINTNYIDNTNGFVPATPNTAATYGATNARLKSYDQIEQAVQMIVDAGAKPNLIICSPDVKQDISSNRLNEGPTTFTLKQPTTQISGYNTYQTKNEHQLPLKPDRFLSAAGVTNNPYILITDTNYWAMAWSGPKIVFSRNKLHMGIEVSGTLVCLNEKASAMIVNVK